MSEDIYAEGLQERSLLNENQIRSLTDHSFCVVENFLDSQALQYLMSYAIQKDEQEAFKLAGTGKGNQFSLHQNYRSDRVKWLSRNEDPMLKQIFFQRMDQMVLFINRAFFTSIVDFECHLSIYAMGSRYKRHSDTFEDSSNRVLSFVLYLNDHWQEENGGELVIYSEKKEWRILPEANRLVVFRSNIEHEVMPTNRPRYSLTGWMLRQRMGLEFLDV